MSRPTQKPRIAVLLRCAMTAALEWRLLTLFTATMLLTTAVAAFPAWRVLANVLDHSPRAQEIAQLFDPLAFEEMVSALVRAAAPVTGATMIATLLAALSWPFLAGMIIGATRAERPSSVPAVIAGGIVYYTRMLRIGFVALVPHALVTGVAALTYWGARRHAAHVILESQANLGERAAWVATMVVFVGVHASLELGRAAFGADDHLRSGWRAWLRGIRLTMRHPLRVLGSYLGTTVVSYAIAAPLLVLRLRVSGPSAVQLVTGFVLTQLAVTSLGWGRAARLFAFTALSRSHSPSMVTTADAPDAVPSEARAVPSVPIVSRPGSA